MRSVLHIILFIFQEHNENISKLVCEGKHKYSIGIICFYAQITHRKYNLYFLDIYKFNIKEKQIKLLICL